MCPRSTYTLGQPVESEDMAGVSPVASCPFGLVLINTIGGEGCHIVRAKRPKPHSFASSHGDLQCQSYLHNPNFALG